ncbi:unnamed protein product [Closterium sp. Naga37s-1]|nr:unnamed protein product [Closterium sp. Naga37s-1]
MTSRFLVTGLPRSLPPLPPGPAPTCVPCVEGRQRAAPHSSEFPPTEAPLETLHMDVWGPARVRGQGHERYFLLVVDDYSHYTSLPLAPQGFTTPPRAVFCPLRTSRLTRWFPTTVSSPNALPPSPPPPLFLAPGPPPVDPLPPQGPAPSGVSQVDAVEPVEVAVDSGAARGAEPVGAGSGGAEPGGAESGGAEPGGAEPERTEPGGTEPGGVEPGGAEPGVAESEGAESEGTEPLREWFARRWSRAAGAGGAGAGGAAGAGAVGGAGAGGAAGAGAPGGAGVGGAAGAGAPGGSGVGAAGAAGGAAGVGADAGGAGVVSAASGGAARPRPYFVPLLQQVLASPSCPRHAPDGTASFHCSAGVPLPSPPASSLAVGPDSESDSLRAASPTVTCLLATVVTDPSFESTAASALVAELVDFAAHCRLDYAASLVAESESVCPPSVGGECALSTDVIEDRQEEFQCFVAALPHLVSMLLASEGDPDAPDIPTPRSYVEAIEGPYSSQWQTTMDAEMAFWKSTGTYVDEVPPFGANIVDGMWIFRVKRPPGSPPFFKARYVARGFSQRQGVDFFQTFSPTPKMTTLWVLLHVAAQRDYELYSLDFSTAFLQGSLHEEIWLRRPPGFTGSFPPGTQWSLRRPVYGLRQAPREWHDTLRTTLAALGFTPTADPSLFLRTDTTLPPFYILVYVDDLVFATADTEGPAHVKSELQKRHTCTDLGELRSYLGLQITWDRAWRTITLNHGAAGPSALRLHVLLVQVHSSAYSPLALSSAFG